MRGLCPIVVAVFVGCAGGPKPLAPAATTSRQQPALDASPSGSPRADSPPPPQSPAPPPSESPEPSTSATPPAPTAPPEPVERRPTASETRACAARGGT